MNEFLTGSRLYGDDFNTEQIKKWYEEETEGYADLGSNDKANYNYGYHELNKIHGYNLLPDKSFKHVLGFGAAYGHEFKPILKKINQLTIIDPSEQLKSEILGNLIPSYVKPGIKGDLAFEKDTFDLITCFGTLHHIPNVSYVVGEILRVLQPGGHFLMREPIISMGDWNQPRLGLTKNERGIPVSVFDELFFNPDLEIISKSYCLTATNFLHRKIGKYFKQPIFKYQSYIYFDKAISKILKGNIHYHAEKAIERIAPSSIFYIVRKLK